MKKKVTVEIEIDVDDMPDALRLLQYSVLGMSSHEPKLSRFYERIGRAADMIAELADDLEQVEYYRRAKHGDGSVLPIQVIDVERVGA